MVNYYGFVWMGKVMVIGEADISKDLGRNGIDSFIYE